MKIKKKIRNSCTWPQGDALMELYHDTEWGVPLHDDDKLFEFMVLDAFQAGLSWKTILHKRRNFAQAFDQFKATKIAQYDKAKIDTLLQDEGIVRNRLKIVATINNAKLFLETKKEFGSFDKYIWQFVHQKPLINHWKESSEIPSRSMESDTMSKDLQKRGFKFVGTTICYAFMQAAGMVNDHVVGCHRYKQVMKK
jgi:DNA-3-methyladenine glycosylase I